MSIEPVNTADRVATFDILSRFIHESQWDYEKFTPLHEKTLRKYQGIALPVDIQQLDRKLKINTEIDMKDNNMFLYLEPTKSKKILPLVTIQSSKNWVHFRIYVLLTMLDEDSNLQALAIRFETNEGYGSIENEIGAHDFCHAQLCRSITSKVPASTPFWMPDSQPSLPLDAEDQIGLVLCMLTSIYGGAHVLRKLNASGDRDLRKHMKKIRALRSGEPLQIQTGLKS